jgi:AcrR family transcriptional regulator
LKNSDTDGRTRRGTANRQAILNAAKKIFLEKGFDDNTMLEISQIAGVGYGTLYTHFNGKDDILKHLIDEIASDFSRLVNIPYRPESAKEVEIRIAKEIKYLLKLAQKHKAILKVAYQAMGQSQVIKEHWNLIFESHISKAIDDYSYSFKKGLTKTGLTPRIVAKANVFIIKEFFWDVVHEKETDIDKISKEVAYLFLHGAYR